jgi:hypothetical protein
MAEINSLTTSTNSVLKGIVLSTDDPVAAEYNPASGLIVIGITTLANINTRPIPVSLMIELLSHEGYHALDASTATNPNISTSFTSQTISAMKAEIPSTDVTQLLVNWVNVRIRDEANAELTAWNGLVGTLYGQTPVNPSQLAALSGEDGGFAPKYIVTVSGGMATALPGLTLGLNGAVADSQPNTAAEVLLFEKGHPSGLPTLTYQSFEPDAALNLFGDCRWKDCRRYLLRSAPMVSWRRLPELSLSCHRMSRILLRDFNRREPRRG